MRFNQCGNATFSYNLENIITGEIDLIKDKEIPGNECGTLHKALPNGVSGAWFDPNRNGEGITNYIYEVDGVQMAKVTWFTYDANGQQMWVSGSGVVEGQSVSISEMNKYTQANFFDGTPQATTMGSLNMNWDNCDNATLNYDFSVSNLGSGEYNLVQLTQPDNTSCDLKEQINN